MYKIFVTPFNKTKEPYFIKLKDNYFIKTLDIEDASFFSEEETLNYKDQLKSIAEIELIKA